MAEDAKVSQVSELKVYSQKMLGFAESVSDNCTALSNLMVQKLDGLRKKLKRAEEMEAQAIAEYNAMLDAIADAANDVEGRKALLFQISKFEHRMNRAKKMREIVHSQVMFAQGAAWAIIDETKAFKAKVNSNVHKGQIVLKKSVEILQQYQETKKTI